MVSLTAAERGKAEARRKREIALQHAALIHAVRRFVDAEQHLDNCRCFLCEALAAAIPDRR